MSAFAVGLVKSIKPHGYNMNEPITQSDTGIVVQGIVKRLTSCVRELEALYPGRPFTLDGHLVGSLGECYAAERFDLELTSPSTLGCDATKDKLRIEIKTTQGNAVALRSEPEHLLVFQLHPDGCFTEIYNGPGAQVWREVEKRPLQKNGQRMVQLSLLRTLMAKVDTGGRLVPRDMQSAVATPHGMAADRALQLIIDKCGRDGDSSFQETIKARSQIKPRAFPSTHVVMQKMAVAIAYSQGAPSSSVKGLIEREVLSQVFESFDPVAVSRMKPESVIAKYWSELGAIRFKKKIAAIIACAKVLLQIEAEYGSFGRYISRFGIPRRITTESDLEQFWRGFDVLLSDLQRRKIPFFGSVTSLLQLFLDLDFDSVKPDLIIMRLARRLGIADSETGEHSLRKTVQALQRFGYQHDVRPLALDWYMLSFGGQLEAREGLSQRYCTGPGVCYSIHCPVGKRGLCADFGATERV